MRIITPEEIKIAKKAAKEKGLELSSADGLWVVKANSLYGQAIEPLERFRGDIVSALIFLINYKEG